jgi:hypothetical protein
MLIAGVEWQTNQRVPDRRGRELVELVADLSRQAAHDAAGRLGGGERSGRPSVVERRRVEERIEQPLVVGGFHAGDGVLVDAVDHLGQHRVAETVDGVRELGRDGAVDVGDAAQERVDQRLHLARELLEHQVLVLHLGAEPRRLEQPLAVAPARARVGGLPRGDFGRRQRVDEAGRRVVDDVIDVRDQPVVLGVEDGVHRRQRDVLVAAAVTGDEVQVEQLVVVAAGDAADRLVQAPAGGRVGVRVENAGCAERQRVARQSARRADVAFGGRGRGGHAGEQQENEQQRRDEMDRRFHEGLRV